jgi:16S rRNA (guanine966-N2)-methyltransferase
MQIVSGRFRHRKLESKPGATTRPITQRVKVALFDRMQHAMQGARVADIFAGTGTIGLEALSRGAASVVFIEKDWDAFELLKRNVASLHVESETLCWRTDVTKCSFRPKHAENFTPFDIVFFDPPYLFTTRIAKGTMLYRSLERLAKPEITRPDVLLVFRCSAETEFEMPEVWQQDRLLNYSSMDVHFYRKHSAGSAHVAPSPD